MFLDEVSNHPAGLPNYSHLWRYTLSLPNLNSVFPNPGALLPGDYIGTTAGDTVVIFENLASVWRS